MDSSHLMERAINTLRFLSADMIQQANSGHPGLPMGAAGFVCTLWTNHLHHNPNNPGWVNRDRFILSGGHGSALLYSLLHLTGYDLPLDELKKFRQWGSRTPGHPEYGLTPGVETTTGPLGQGFANGVGMAIAQAHLREVFNRKGYDLLSHHIYAVVTDGDLMEGVSSEAASLAGHLKLNRLVYLYDDNRITIDGSTSLTFTENVENRFRSYGWNVQKVEGNDSNQVDAALSAAHESNLPNLLICKTEIGYGSPNKQGTSAAHGEPLGEDELLAAKENLNWPVDPLFYIPVDVLDYFRQAYNRGEVLEQEWNEMFEAYKAEYPLLAAEFNRRKNKALSKDWDKDLPSFPTDDIGLATRAASGKILQVLAERIPELIGGSADLAPSTKTWMDGFPAFQEETPHGRNFHFGVREHAMGAVVNGLTLYGSVIPYGATFLVFSDYMRPAIRLAALSKLHSIFIFTHDSIGVGEDGPTHQAVEHLAALRSIPNLIVIRPSDANETVEAWKAAISHHSGPTALILSRQNVPTIDRKKYQAADGLSKGAYVLADLGDSKPQLILMASGSEVAVALKAGLELRENGISSRIVSFPSWELFAMQTEEYHLAVLPTEIKNRVAVEAGIAQGWERWIGDSGKIISLERYGASAPAQVLYQEFKITIKEVVARALEMVAEAGE